MADGWIKLARQLQEHWLWLQKPFSAGQAWVDLLLLANYEEKKTVVRGTPVVCKRGDVNVSILALADRWGWSRHRVSDFLNVLEKDSMITQKRTSKRTVVSIVNYDNFQFSVPAADIRRTSDGTSEGQQKDTTNKEKNKRINKFIAHNRFLTGMQQDYDFNELEKILSGET